jgi:hypothetical protein
VIQYNPSVILVVCYLWIGTISLSTGCPRLGRDNTTLLNQASIYLPFCDLTVFATSGLQSHFAHCCSHYSKLQSSTSWDLIDVCEWMSNLDSTFWDWEKWNQFIIVYNTLYDEAAGGGGGAPGAPPKIGKNKIFWRKIVIFHTKYPKKFRASHRSAQFF